MVTRAYSLALNRAPTKSERDNALEFIGKQKLRYDTVKKSNARELAVTDFAQVVLSLNEFIYAD